MTTLGDYLKTASAPALPEAPPASAPPPGGTTLGDFLTASASMLTDTAGFPDTTQMPETIPDPTQLQYAFEPQTAPLDFWKELNQIDPSSVMQLPSLEEIRAREAQREEMLSRPKGPMSVLQETNLLEQAPFSPVGLVKSGLLYQAVKRLEADAYDHERDKLADQYRVNSYLAQKQQDARRGYTTGGAITKGILELPSFMIEFWLTGGLANLGKKGMQKGLEKLGQEAAEKSIARRTAEKGLEWTAGAATRTLGMPHRVGEAVLDRSVESKLYRTPKGELLLGEAQEQPWTSFLKGTGSVLIENMTEVAGPGLSAAGKTIGRKIAGKSPLARKLGEVIGNAWKRLPGGRRLDRVAAKAGYHGFLEEMGEEELGKLMRYGLGVDSFAEFVAQYQGDALFVQAGVLLAPAILRTGGAILVDVAERKQVEQLVGQLETYAAENNLNVQINTETTTGGDYAVEITPLNEKGEPITEDKTDDVPRMQAETQREQTRPESPETGPEAPEARKGIEPSPPLPEAQERPTEPSPGPPEPDTGNIRADLEELDDRTLAELAEFDPLAAEILAERQTEEVPEPGTAVQPAETEAAEPGPGPELQPDPVEAQTTGELVIRNPLTVLQAPKGAKTVKAPDIKGNETKFRDVGGGIYVKGRDIIHAPSKRNIYTVEKAAHANAVAVYLKDQPIDWTQDKEMATQQAIDVLGNVNQVIHNYEKSLSAEITGPFSTTYRQKRTQIEGRLRELGRVVPEWTHNPIFKVQDGKLDYVGKHYRYRIEPDYYGLDPAQLTEGQIVRFDLDSYRIKPAGKTVMKREKPFYDSPRAQTGALGRKVEVLPITPATGGPSSGPGGGRENVPVEIEAVVRGAVSTGRIVRSIRDAIQKPIRGVATYRRRVAAAWYDPQEELIRLKDMGDFPAAIHEAGHWLDYFLHEKTDNRPEGPRNSTVSGNAPAAVKQELRAVGRELYEKEPHNGWESEGWAEFVRLYLTDEPTARRKLPLTTELWRQKMAEYPDLAQSLGQTKGLIDTWKAQGSQARVRAQQLPDNPVGRLRDRFSDMLFQLEVNFRDELAPIRRVVEAEGIDIAKLKPEDNPYLIAQVRADKASATARYWILHGPTDLAGNQTGKSLAEILAPVADDIKNFTDYLVARRAGLLHMKGKTTGFLDVDVQNVLDKYDSDQWRTVSDEVTDWSHRLLDYLSEAGGLAPESLNRIKETNPVYVPFQRAFEVGEFVGTVMGPGRGIKSLRSAVKKFTGSGREIIDPLDSLMRQAQYIASAAHKAEVTRALVNLARKSKGLGRYMAQVPQETIKRKISLADIESQLKRHNIVLRDVFNENEGELSDDWFRQQMEIMEALGVWSISAKNAFFGKENIIPLHIAGEKTSQTQWWELDPELYKTLDGMETYHLPWWLDMWAGKANRLLRLGATGLNPSFGMVRNPIRDALTFSVTAEHARLGPLSAFKGIVDDALGTAEARKAQALGLQMAGFIGQDRAGIRGIRDEVLSPGVGGKVYVTVRHPVEAIRKLFGITETGTRLGEFQAALKTAEAEYGVGSRSAAYVSLQAGQDVTTNFTRHGRMAKVANQLIPFFNAAIQGPDKLIRSFRSNPTRFLFRSSVLTGITLFLWSLTKDEEWYQDMDPKEKALYWHLPIEETDEIIRIPRPFELGALFAAIPEAIANSAVTHDEGKEVIEALKISAIQAFPGILPSAMQPLLEVAINEDWAGRPIVSPWDILTLPESAQVKRHTTGFSRELGQYLDYSPAKLDHLFNGYTGGLYRRLYRLFLPETDLIGEQSASDLPVIGTLFMREPQYPAKPLRDFYDERERLTRLSNDPDTELSDADDRQRLNLNRAARIMSGYFEQLREAPGSGKRVELYHKMRKLALAALAGTPAPTGAGSQQRRRLR